ncbi:MAG TPA: MupG family TIM beta-alpha barrel fold protein, partial [Bacilli bacterium]|nr:MupG family TIM beta-alpha barrel fold protein [Bacilli bacterium]
AHIFFKALEENQLPATLSKKVITGLLREDLGFKGLIISDALEMKAIADNYGVASGAVQALLAGQDLLIVSSNYDYQVEVLEAIHQAVVAGVIPLATLDEKIARILAYKNSLQKAYEDKFVNKTYRLKEEIILNKESKDFVSKIVDESLTLVKGKSINPNLTTLVLAPSPFAMTVVEEDISDRSIVRALKHTNLNGEALKISLSPNHEEIEALVRKAKQYQQVLVCTYSAANYPGQVELVNQLFNTAGDLFVLSTKSPYDIFRFKQIKNYLCLYEYTPNSVNTVVNYLVGKIKPEGCLPVKLMEKIKVGASIYVGLKEYPLVKNLEYLQLLKDNGIDRAFISAHIPEMNEGFVNELIAVCAKAKVLDIKIILDVSKPMMEKFVIPDIYSLRLDYGFSNDDIVKLCKQEKFIVEFNASTVNDSQLEYFKNKGVDLNKVRISHNFYPKLYTGLTREEVIRRNQIFKKYGLSVMMYIPSQNQQRPPMYEGLPTIEAHRHQPLEAILSEVRGLGIDEVFFGDSYASLEEIQMATQFNYDLVQIPIIVNKNLTETEKSQLCFGHRNRIDQPQSFIRSACRLKEGQIPSHNAIERKKGDITIDNELFARYQGEVCLMLEDLPKDERVNVVGKIACDGKTLTFIKPGDRFKLIIKGEE